MTPPFGMKILCWWITSVLYMSYSKPQFDAAALSLSVIKSDTKSDIKSDAITLTVTVIQVIDFLPLPGKFSPQI
jgi:hypothetical protein